MFSSPDCGNILEEDITDHLEERAMLRFMQCISPIEYFQGAHFKAGKCKFVMET